MSAAQVQEVHSALQSYDDEVLLAAFTLFLEQRPELKESLLSALSTAASERYIGTIKQFDPSKGCGFIDCQDTEAIYGLDVWIQSPAIGTLKVGSIVEFSVRLNKAGNPQAEDLQDLSGIAAGDPSAMAPQPQQQQQQRLQQGFSQQPPQQQWQQPQQQQWQQQQQQQPQQWQQQQMQQRPLQQQQQQMQQPQQWQQQQQQMQQQQQQQQLHPQQMHDDRRLISAASQSTQSSVHLGAETQSPRTPQMREDMRHISATSQSSLKFTSEQDPGQGARGETRHASATSQRSLEFTSEQAQQRFGKNASMSLRFEQAQAQAQAKALPSKEPAGESTKDCQGGAKSAAAAAAAAACATKSITHVLTGAMTCLRNGIRGVATCKVAAASKEKEKEEEPSFTPLGPASPPSSSQELVAMQVGVAQGRSGGFIAGSAHKTVQSLRQQQYQRSPHEGPSAGHEASLNSSGSIPDGADFPEAADSRMPTATSEQFKGFSSTDTLIGTSTPTERFGGAMGVPGPVTTMDLIPSTVIGLGGVPVHTQEEAAEAQTQAQAQAQAQAQTQQELMSRGGSAGGEALIFAGVPPAGPISPEAFRRRWMYSNAVGAGTPPNMAAAMQMGTNTMAAFPPGQHGHENPVVGSGTSGSSSGAATPHRSVQGAMQGIQQGMQQALPPGMPPDQAAGAARAMQQKFATMNAGGAATIQQNAVAAFSMRGMRPQSAGRTRPA